jgi:hypothetical protein
MGRSGVVTEAERHADENGRQAGRSVSRAPLHRRRFSGWLAAIAVLVLGLTLSMEDWDLVAAPPSAGAVTAPASAVVAGGATQLATPSPARTAMPTPGPVVSGSPTSGPTPTPTSRITAAPTPRPAQGVVGVYGSAIGMDSLNNTQVGGPHRIATSYRFRASTSASLKSIRVYVIGPTHSGYGAGTGGTWRVSVQADNGASNHAPSGTILATTNFKPVDNFPVIAWRSPAILTAGRLYHVVFENIDPDPVANFASLDGVFMYQPTSPRQPAFSNVNWGQPMRLGSGAWADLSNTVPIMQLNYSNGAAAGLGYMEVWVRSYKSISGAAMAREAFTVRGSSRSVSSFSVRLMRISGSSPLTVSLKNSGGATIDECVIAASAVAIGTPGDHGGGGHATWETCRFGSARTLVAGQAYSVVLSTPANTVYSIFVIRKGSSWGFASTTYFLDGHAQYTTGSRWGPFTQDGGGAVDQADLQFYFR